MGWSPSKLASTSKYFEAVFLTTVCNPTATNKAENINCRNQLRSQDAAETSIYATPTLMIHDIASILRFFIDYVTSLNYNNCICFPQASAQIRVYSFVYSIASSVVFLCIGVWEPKHWGESAPLHISPPFTFLFLLTLFPYNNKETELCLRRE